MEEQIEAISREKTALVQQHELHQAGLTSQIEAAKSETAAIQRDLDSLQAKLASVEAEQESVVAQHNSEQAALREQINAASVEDDTKRQLMDSMEVKFDAMRRELEAANKKREELAQSLRLAEEKGAEDRAQHHQLREQFSSVQSEAVTRQQERGQLDKLL